jgi:RHS repeat-associated protein
MRRANPFRFSTKYQDDETDFLYYGYRYCNASTGRWLSRDLLGEKGGANLYAGELNDAVNRIDPLGLIAVTSTCLGQHKVECEEVCRSQGGVKKCVQTTYYSGRPGDLTASFSISACWCKCPDPNKDPCYWTGGFKEALGCEYLCVDRKTGQGYYKYAPKGATGCRGRITNP